MTRTFRSGAVTVELDGALQDFVDGLIQRTATSSLIAARELAEKVARDARAHWYGDGGVRRVTGQSGDIQVREVVDLQRGEVRVSVGSTDKRVSGGKPVPVFVKRPGRLSVVRQSVTIDQWFAAPKSMRANFKSTRNDPPGTSPPYLFVPNPNASDGKFQLLEWVRKPVKAGIRRAARSLGEGVSRGR